MGEFHLSKLGKLNRHFSWSDPSEPYLSRLREISTLGSRVDFSTDPVDAALIAMEWVHSRFSHNGLNEASKCDPISILEEAATLKSFRCVEFAIVTAAILTSLGQRARVVALKTADVETRETCAGHVVVEVFDRSRRGWFFADSQWGLVPGYNGKPINGLELKRLLDAGVEVGGLAASSGNSSGFSSWIHPYLFYFNTAFDQRFGESFSSSPEHLMYVPKGAAEPKIFQRYTPRDLNSRF